MIMHWTTSLRMPFVLPPRGRTACRTCMVVIGLLLTSSWCPAAVLGLGQPVSSQGTIVVPVAFAPAAGEEVASTQFSFQYNAAEFEFAGIATGQAAASAGKEAVFGDQNGYTTVVVAGINQEAIPEGIVAILYLNPRNASGSSPAASLNNIVFSDPQGQPVAVEKDDTEKDRESDDDHNTSSDPSTDPQDPEPATPSTPENSHTKPSSGSLAWNNGPVPLDTDTKAASTHQPGSKPLGASLPPGTPSGQPANSLAFPKDGLTGMNAAYPSSNAQPVTRNQPFAPAAKQRASGHSTATPINAVEGAASLGRTRMAARPASVPDALSSQSSTTWRSDNVLFREPGDKSNAGPSLFTAHDWKFVILLAGLSAGVLCLRRWLFRKG